MQNKRREAPTSFVYVLRVAASSAFKLSTENYPYSTFDSVPHLLVDQSSLQFAHRRTIYNSQSKYKIDKLACLAGKSTLYPPLSLQIPPSESLTSCGSSPRATLQGIWTAFWRIATWFLWIFFLSYLLVTSHRKIAMECFAQQTWSFILIRLDLDDGVGGETYYQGTETFQSQHSNWPNCQQNALSLLVWSNEDPTSFIGAGLCSLWGHTTSPFFLHPCTWASVLQKTWVV